jgi:hypothetical protein
MYEKITATSISSIYCLCKFPPPTSRQPVSMPLTASICTGPGISKFIENKQCQQVKPSHLVSNLICGCDGILLSLATFSEPTGSAV